MKLFLSLLVFSSMAFAAGDPNLEMESNNQSGTMVPGADFKAQVNACVKCQNRNNLRLPDSKDNAARGTVETNGTSAVKKEGSGI